MKICPKCGTSLEDHMNFCNVCGQNQSVVTQFQIPFKAPVMTIGLFIALGTFVAYLSNGIASTVLTALNLYPLPTLASTLVNFVYALIFVGVCCVGFLIYNNTCTRKNHPEKKIPIFWVAIPWVIRGVMNFLYGFIFGLVMPIVYQNPDLNLNVLTVVIPVAAFIWMLINAGVNALITTVILRAVVKNK